MIRHLLERIGWKWEAVLSRLAQKIELKSNLKVRDWGCGSGIASRKFFEHFKDHISEIIPEDRSRKAVDFANKRLKEIGYSKIEAESEKAMLISHVLTELSDSQKEKLVSEVKDSSFFVWIEPGTKRESHTLINIRENLKDEFDFILPCPHQNSCPLKKLGK